MVAIRSPDGTVRIKQSVNLVGLGAAQGGLSGALWGSLVGLLFLNPLLGFAAGAAVGAGSGALAGSLGDYGIDDDLIRSIGDTLQPEHLGPVRAGPQGAAGEGPGRAVGLQGPGDPVLPVAGAGTAAPGGAVAGAAGRTRARPAPAPAPAPAASPARPAAARRRPDRLRRPRRARLTGRGPADG